MWASGMYFSSSTALWMKLYFTEMILLSLSTSIRSFSKSQWSTLEGEATEGNMAGEREIEIDRGEIEGRRERGMEGEREGHRERERGTQGEEIRLEQK